MKTKTLSVVLGFGLSCALAASAVAEDPLFALMQGHWVAGGERVYLTSGRKFSLHMVVDSKVQGDFLVSTNDITETPEASGGGSSDQPLHYSRVYWIRPSTTSGTYELGVGNTGQGQLSSQAQFTSDATGARLVTEQKLDAAGTLIVKSETLFAPAGGESNYTETLWQGATELSQAKVTYKAAPGTK